MEYQIAIYSGDAVFARMLELEFVMRGLSVLTAERPDDTTVAEVVLLDLDSSHPPHAEQYRRMIGFTRGSAQSSDDAHRQCSMILHRPFEMRLLRREVLGEMEDFPRAPGTLSVPQPRSESEKKWVLDETESTLCVGEKHVPLSPNELAVMKLLLDLRGEAVSRESIASVIGESSANKTDVYICFLRRKLEEQTGERCIKTVRGKGYRIP